MIVAREKWSQYWKTSHHHSRTKLADRPSSAVDLPLQIVVARLDSEVLDFDEPDCARTIVCQLVIEQDLLNSKLARIRERVGITTYKKPKQKSMISDNQCEREALMFHRRGRGKARITQSIKILPTLRTMYWYLGKHLAAILLSQNPGIGQHVKTHMETMTNVQMMTIARAQSISLCILAAKRRRYCNKKATLTIPRPV